MAAGADGQVFLSQEGDLFSRTAQDEEVAPEIDAALVPFQHVQPEQKIHIVVLQHRECAGQVRLADLAGGYKGRRREEAV